MLRLFQLREHPSVQRLAGGIIPGLGVLMGREKTGTGDVPRLHLDAVLSLRQRIQHRLTVPHGLLLEFRQPLHPFPCPLVQMDAAEKQVEQATENGQRQNGHDPGDLVIWMAGFGDDGNDR